MKMYKYTEEDREIIAKARKANKDKRAEKRLYAMALRAEGKSAKEIAERSLKIAGSICIYTNENLTIETLE